MFSTLPPAPSRAGLRRFAAGRSWRRLALATASLLGLTASAQAQGVLESWPLTVDASATAATGVTPTQPTLTGLVLFTTPYSTGRGQGIAPVADGSGWGNTATLSRTRYEEFTVTAATGYRLKVDSLILSTVINNSANGRLGVSYSTDNFTTIQEVSGGTLNGDIATPVTGSFVAPVTPANATGATTPTVNTHTYRLALNGVTGVQLASGTTVTIRLYYAVGSGSAGRQAQLKAVSAKGTATANGPVCANVTNLTAPAAGITATSAQLTFTPGASNASYTVTYTPASGTTTTLPTNPTASPVGLTGLTGGTTYTATVQSTCTGGGVSAVQSVTFTTAPAPVCTDPGSVRIINQTATTAQLAFTPGTNNTSYTAVVTPQGGTALPAVTGTASPLTLTGLTVGTVYTVTLQSACSSNGGSSSIITRTFTVPVANSTRLQMWSLRVNAADSAAVRATGVAASTPTLTGLTLSDGTTVPTVPAYSAAYGQAFAPNANGTWGSSATPNPGPGGSLNRAYYEQFTITGAANYTLRVDSLVLSSAFYASNSNTKLGLSYSTDGFTTVLESTGGFGPGNTTVTSSFASPIILPNILAVGTPNPNTYRLALNGTTGVSVAPGQVLTLRLYYSCGSTSTGRYALLRDVIAKGTAAAPGCSANFTYPGTAICAGQTATVSPTLATGATAGTFTSTTGLSISAAGVINPATSTPGTYIVTNTIAAGGSCAATSATQSVTILPVAVATFNYGASTSLCRSQTTAQAVVLGTGATAGTFTSTAGLTIAANGAITPSTSTAGTYTVTNTVAANGTRCGSTATTTVTIVAPATASFTYPTATTAGSACAGSTGTLAPAVGTGSSAGTFSSTTGLDLNATTGVISLATSAAGTYTVTNTLAASNGCAAVTSTQAVTINPTPAQPTLTQTAQPNGQVLLTSSATSGNQFLLGGQPVTGATGTTYLVASSTGNGAYTVVATGTGGCASATSAAQTVAVVLAARPAGAAASLRAFPNPTPSGEVTLELTGYTQAAELTVVNALGQVVSTQQLPASAAGSRMLPVQLPAARGLYLLQLRSAEGRHTLRVVRQ